MNRKSRAHGSFSNGMGRRPFSSAVLSHFSGLGLRCWPGPGKCATALSCFTTPWLGGITWAVIFGELGYIFGRNLPRLEHYIGQATLAFILLAVLIVALFLGGSWFRKNSTRLSAEIARGAGRLGSSPSLQHLRARHPQTWEFLVRRFEPGEYLGLHLTVGLVISIGALWLFGGVTEDVIHHDPLTQFDLMLLEWFHGHSTIEGVAIFTVVSSLASPLVLTALGAVIAIMLTVKRLDLFRGLGRGTCRCRCTG